MSYSRPLGSPIPQDGPPCSCPDSRCVWHGTGYPLRYIETVNVGSGPVFPPVYRLTIDGVVCGRGQSPHSALETEIRNDARKCEALYQAFANPADLTPVHLVGFKNLEWAHEYAARLRCRFICHACVTPGSDGMYRIIIDEDRMEVDNS